MEMDVTKVDPFVLAEFAKQAAADAEQEQTAEQAVKAGQAAVALGLATRM